MPPARRSVVRATERARSSAAPGQMSGLVGESTAEQPWRRRQAGVCTEHRVRRTVAAAGRLTGRPDLGSRATGAETSNGQRPPRPPPHVEAPGRPSWDRSAHETAVVGVRRIAAHRDPTSTCAFRARVRPTSNALDALTPGRRRMTRSAIRGRSPATDQRTPARVEPDLVSPTSNRRPGRALTGGEESCPQSRWPCRDVAETLGVLRMP